MSSETLRSPIDLPGLTSSRFGMFVADVKIARTSDSGLAHAQLTLEGDDDVYKYRFADGHLTVHENTTSGTVLSQIVSRGIFDRIVISDTSVRINGVDIGSTHTNPKRRCASLLLPLNYLGFYDIDTKSGDVELEAITARTLKVATMSGDIALRGVVAHTINLNTMSGDAEVEETKSETSVPIKTMSGDINVSGSEAPYWRLSTMSGDIKVKTTRGVVDASSMSGRTRVG